MNTQTTTTYSRAQLRAAWAAELDAARTARSTGAHVRTHVAMFTVALRRHDRHELIGQLFRIIVAAPGSMTGRYPVGNTGGADVSAFAPMPIPEDLQPLLPDTGEAP